MLLLTSFSRCFSSLGVLLLNSMSLRISGSFLAISSVSFAAAVSPSLHRLHCLHHLLNFVHVVADM